VLLIARSHVPAPSRPIGRGLGGPRLFVYTLVSKFVDHLPLYRQSEIYAREGMDLQRSTLTDWVGQSNQLLRPLISTLERHVMSGLKTHVDCTPIGALTPGHDKTKNAHLWMYVLEDRPAGYSTGAAV
jgi:transposase